METNTASTDTATTTRYPISTIWVSGFMALYDGDTRISNEFEVSEKDFTRMSRMVGYFVNIAYAEGKRAKALEIQKALYLQEQDV